MILTALGVLMVPGVHAVAKELGGTLSPGQVAFFRYFFQALMLLPMALIAMQFRLPMPNMSFVLRGALLGVSSMLYFWALTRMSLAESSSIFFVEPLILTLISAAFLGESISYRRVLAVIVGFSGAMIVIRPNFQVVGPIALLPLATAFFIAVHLAITRQMAAHEDSWVMQFWVCVFAALTLLVGMVFGELHSIDVLLPRWVSGWQIWALIAMAAVATVSQMLVISGIRRAPAGIVAPFQYLEILGAVIFGVLFFSDIPDGPTFLGTVIIVGAGLYVFRRERIMAKRASLVSTRSAD